MNVDSSKTKSIGFSPAINQWFYGAFVLFAALLLLLNKDVMMAASNMGIALIFDPFVKAGTWKDRRTWQKAWLLVHLSIVFLLFGCGLFNR